MTAYPGDPWSETRGFTRPFTGRTVSRLLSAAEADLYEGWILNRRALKDTQRRMLALSKKVAPLLLRKAKSGKRT